MCWDKTRHVIFSSCQRRETNKCQVQNQYKWYVSHTLNIQNVELHRDTRYEWAVGVECLLASIIFEVINF